MAELKPLYMDVDSVYSGDELGLPFRDIMGEGVVGTGDLITTQRAAGANLSVDVSAGACWVKGDDNAAAQPTYRCRNDATVNLLITPDGSNPRNVIIIAEVIDQGFAGSGRLWQLRAVHGTPASSPVDPATPNNAIRLARVAVTAGDIDITNSQIIDLRTFASVGGGSATGSVSGGVPAGAVLQYGGSSAPAGWLLCDGSAVSRSTFATLFAAIGTSYGAGDGSTTFNIPNTHGRMPVGKGSHADVDNLGDADAEASGDRRPGRLTFTTRDPAGGTGGGTFMVNADLLAKPGFLTFNFIIKT